MAVTYLDRFTIPLGRLRRELIYVNNVANDDVVKVNLSKIFSAHINVAGGPTVAAPATFGAVVSCDVSTSGGREIVTIRDPDAVSTTVYEIDVLGQ